MTVKVAESIYPTGACARLLEFLSATDMTQNNFVTNANSRTLDLNLISNNFIVNVIRSDEPLVPEDSHHPTLSVTVSLSCIVEHSNFIHASDTVRYNFRLDNYLGLYNALSTTNWSRIAEFNDIKGACDYFYNVLNLLIDTYVPKTPVKQSSYPIW